VEVDAAGAETGVAGVKFERVRSILVPKNLGPMFDGNVALMLFPPISLGSLKCEPGVEHFKYHQFAIVHAFYVTVNVADAGETEEGRCIVPSSCCPRG
jgi:hypothetical protein